MGPEERPSLSDRLSDAAIDAAAGTAGVLAQLHLGDQLSGAAITPAVALGLRLTREAVVARRGRVERVIDVAASELGGLDRLDSLVGGDPARLELLARVVEASQRSTIPDKVDALGRVLATGLSAQDRVDEALVLAAALHDLEAPHVLILAELHREPLSSVVAAYRGPGRLGWTPEQVVARLPGTRIVIDALLQVLRTHGLIRNLNEGEGSTYADLKSGQPRYAATELGRYCLGLLNEARRQDDAGT